MENSRSNHTTGKDNGPDKESKTEELSALRIERSHKEDSNEQVQSFTNHKMLGEFESSLDLKGKKVFGKIYRNPVLLTDVGRSRSKNNDVQHSTKTVSVNQKKIYAAYDKDAAVFAFNKARSYHGVADLVWDQTLADHAFNWVVYLLDKNIIDHTSNYCCEDTIFWMYNTIPKRIYDAVQSQYSEIQYYDFENQGKYENDDAAFAKVGHFVEIVSKLNKTFGCAVAYDDKARTAMIVARFHPGGGYSEIGNVVPQLEQGNSPPYKKAYTPPVEEFISPLNANIELEKVESYSVTPGMND